MLGLTDDGGTWRGGASYLVLLGDLVGGHKDSRFVVEWVRRLEREAARTGGRVIALIGNHDLLPSRGDVSKMTSAERERYRRTPVEGASGRSAKQAFRGDSEYAKWLRGRNSVVKVGATLFAHAGVGEWLTENDPGSINATVRAWIRFWQGCGPSPSEETQWAVGTPDMKRTGPESVGPLWNRTFKPDGKKDSRRPRGAPSRETVEQALARWGAERLVVGHAPTPESEILLEHPYFGSRVVMVDTRISDPKGGTLAAVRIEGSLLDSITVKQKKRDSAATDREMMLLKESSGAAEGFFRRLWRDWFDQ